MDKIKELIIYALIILWLIYIGAYVQKNGVVIEGKNVGWLLNNTWSIICDDQQTYD